MKRIFILFVFLISSNICALADEVLDVKLPPDYKIIIKNQDFPITLRPLVKTAFLRVIVYHMMYKGEFKDNMVTKIQILDNDKNAIYTHLYHKFGAPNELTFEEWAQQLEHEPYVYGENFYGYAAIQGKNKDYLLYMIDFPTASDRYPYYCIGANKNNTEIIELKQDYEIYPSELDIINPKISNNNYQLIEDKYIVFPYFDGWFSYSVKFEIKNDELLLVNNEYKIEHYSVAWYSEPHEIALYPKPFNRLNGEKIIVKPNSEVKILGIRYGIMNYVHVIINGKEGWIEENDSQYIGVGRAG